LQGLGRDAASRLLKQLRGRRVLVAGDVMLDEFLWGSVSRISPEAPVPVVKVTRQSDHLGGAGNVACNVRALGGEAVVVGVVGRDAAGERVHAALAEAGVEDGLVVADGGRPTTVKTRVIAHHQQVVRADRELADDVPARLEQALLERVKAALPSCAAVVLSDYHKGVVTARLMKPLLALARAHGVPVLVDPKVAHFPLYRKVTVVTPNQQEAEQAAGRAIRSPDDLRAVGLQILRLLACDAVLVTRGEQGMALFPRDGKPALLPTAAREVYDVTGAGDTVIATLALALSAGAPLARAAMLANHAAGVVVGKLGTATASPDEVLAALERRGG
jgi:D-beta-D-heptose 7-phosphate kinase/D-beta-D-heptose 1-phosphate adenosyltransferase